MNIHIDRYAMINMKGLVQLVDKVGGITVNNPFDFDISIEENEPEYTAKNSTWSSRRLMENKHWYIHGCVIKIQKETMVVKNATGSH